MLFPHWGSGGHSNRRKRSLGSPPWQGHALHHWAGVLHPFTFEPQRTLCEPSPDGSFPKPSKNDRLHGEISPNNPYKEQIVEMRRQLHEPCEACMYTGVGVCLGLSLYFMNLATEETTLPKNRRFLWICSASSIVAGAYRFYLG